MQHLTNSFSSTMGYLLLLLLHFVSLASQYAGGVLFNQSYYETFGGSHLTLLEGGNQVQLLIDQSSGAGFSSIQEFGSGLFVINMKLPTKNTTAIVTSFYLTSRPVGKKTLNHDELDLEFLGGNGMPYTLRTNVFVSDAGGREQDFHLWFNPTEDFHTYKILWNQYQIVFFVEDTPVRVFKNNKKIGVNYPSNSMHIEASIWNPINWLGPVNWTQGPFMAFYSSFAIDGCLYQSSIPQKCYSSAYYWNAQQFWKLNPDQEKKLSDVRQKYMVYDYCRVQTRPFPECRS